MLPRNALSSAMVWNAGAGPWWAATAGIFKCHLLSTLTSKQYRKVSFVFHFGGRVPSSRLDSFKCGKSLCIS
jgi:hypothetical protein